MKATAFEFRHRFWILVAIYVLGFIAPWDAVFHVDGTGANAHLWGVLAVVLAKTGMSIGAAFNLLLVMGILCAGSGAWLRTWGSAYLGADVMQDSAMRAEGVVADGPPGWGCPYARNGDRQINTKRQQTAFERMKSLA